VGGGRECRQRCARLAEVARPMSAFYARQHYAVARICHDNSACLSVTRVLCVKTAERIIEILSLSDRPIILVFRQQGSLHNAELTVSVLVQMIL